MKSSIKATVLAAILAIGISEVSCGGFTSLSGDTITNCQYEEVKTKILERYPTGKEVFHIDDWPLITAVIDVETRKEKGIFNNLDNRIQSIIKINQLK